jgi:hypothetical protein
MNIKQTKIYLTAEMLIVFFGLPILFYFDVINPPEIPALIILALICSLYLFRTKKFDNYSLIKLKGIKPLLPKILIRSIPISIGLTFLTYIILPKKFFHFPINEPFFWILVVLFYPILSAYPQELVYRAFFINRYKPLFNSRLQLILVNMAAFGLLHIIYENLIAVGITFFGSYVFYKTYENSNSVLVTALEHALYGNIIFTIGLGYYFY